MSIAITFDRALGAYRLRFPYDQAMVAAIKSLPNAARRWDAPSKTWLISPDFANEAKWIVLAHYPGATFPEAIPAEQAQEQITLLEVRYLGATKERGVGEVTAMGLLPDGSWGVVFPEAVLLEWFEGQRQVPSTQSLYAVLGARQTASSEEIKSAYRRMARQWHPDVCKEPNAHDVFLRIQAAYEALSDADKRARYDAGLKFQASLMKQPAHKSTVGYRAPLRCGQIMVKAKQQLGTWIVSEILAWQDIVDRRGRTLVVSWPLGADKPVEAWA